MTGVRLLETVSRHAALGIRFRDLATGDAVIQGLTVRVAPRANPRAGAAMTPNRSGVYVAHAVAGLRGFEFSDAPPATLWATPPRPYRVEVDDPAGRYLPCAFDVDLPQRGLFGLLSPWAPVASPPGSGVVPLFSAPARSTPEPLAVLRAQLRWAGSKNPAAWALLSVSIGGQPRGLGLADAAGRVAVFFAYPEPPRRQLTSPPEPRDDFGWEVELQAFHDPALRAAPAPDLEQVLGQLVLPVTVLGSLHSPARPLHLDYRVPLTARTEGAAGDDASYLFLAA